MQKRMLPYLEKLLVDSVFRGTLLGFANKDLENAFQNVVSFFGKQALAVVQIQTSVDARNSDLVADALLFSLVTVGLYQSLIIGMDWASTIFLFVAGGVIFLGRAYLTICWPNGLRKARWRLGFMLAFRLHALIIPLLWDGPVEGPKMAIPEPAASIMFANLIYLSRVPQSLVLTLGQRIPFRLHLPLQLFSTCCYTYLNWRHCQLCSPPMQEAFAGVAQSLTRLVTAGLLLQPPARRPVIPTEHACSAVSGFCVYLFASLLPNAVAFYMETESRGEFLQKVEQRWRLRTGKSAPWTAERARRRINHEATLAVYPLLVALLLVPAAALIWNLILHTHHLL